MHLLFKGKNHVLEAVELFLFLWDNVSWTLHVLNTKIKPSKLIEFFKSIVKNFQIFLKEIFENLLHCHPTSCMHYELQALRVANHMNLFLTDSQVWTENSDPLL